MSVDVNTLQSLGLANTSPAAAKTKSLGQNEFLKLMVAQLNNQNPTKPLDNTEFLSQMAQFSTVTGLQELQSSFKDFVSSYQQEQTLTAANLVGRSALVASDRGTLSADGAIGGKLVLPADASSVTLRITDSNGQLVKTEELGPQPAGSLAFTWNGEGDGSAAHAAAGTYHIKAEAVIAGQNTALETQVAAPVTGVSLGGAKGIEVELQGLGRYSLSDIQGVF